MHQSGDDALEMDAEDAKQPPPSEDGTVSSARVDPDEEVTGSGSGGMGKIRSMLCPPPIPDVDDWGIPPESQMPCDPEVEVSNHRRVRMTRRKIGSITPLFSLFNAGKAHEIPHSQKRP